ncbi:H-2 class II histocompatibility antigen, A-Q alpha chain-like [Melanotaenia boesemani]|uniref:H-2 class II histocompatibility antigen, A-Q alpha chain-like n=1 Tax=Melanotaenia boesemani TaxID=1250792 RepID=UPI001C04CB9A|nr:H-2 class II histocompatibility antigen, A-Q alpha chain-like [Melanotaenia boesemani]
MFVIALIVITGAVCASTTTPSHEFHFSYGCYETDDVRVDLVVDGDMAGYADFTKKEIVWAMPQLPQLAKDFAKRIFEIAESSTVRCHSVLGKAKKADPGSPLRQEAPDISIYTRYEGEDGVVNTLFCLANDFYPPTINFTWTKNDVEVTEGVLNLRYRHNSDGTFHRISTLSLIPREGDFYSCKVQHEASEQPLSITWKLKKKMSSSAAKFFTSSLVLSLIGIMTGVFFLIKKPN